MTKIAYVYINRMALAGVEKKSLQQAKAIEHLNLPGLDIHVLHPHRRGEQDGIYYHKIDRLAGPLHLLDFGLTYNFFRYRCVRKLPLSEYDAIILRYDKADASGIRLARLMPVFTEHHTDERTELFSEAKASRSIFFKIFKWLRASLEAYYGGPMLRSVRGIIAISDDVRNIQEQKAGRPLNAAVVPNGIGVGETPFSRFKPFDGTTLHLVFPASHFNPYHGLDRLLASMDAYNGPVTLELHLVGNFDHSRLIRHRCVNYHGQLSEPDYERLMAEMNLGVSTLAVYRRNLTDPAALKTREFMARGLPFIIGYSDVDLKHLPSAVKPMLEFPNDRSLLDFQKILQFVEAFNAPTEGLDLSLEMRRYAEQHLDWARKLEHYYRFVHDSLTTD